MDESWPGCCCRVLLCLFSLPHCQFRRFTLCLLSCPLLSALLILLLASFHHSATLPKHAAWSLHNGSWPTLVLLSPSLSISAAGPSFHPPVAPCFPRLPMLACLIFSRSACFISALPYVLIRVKAESSTFFSALSASVFDCFSEPSCYRRCWLISFPLLATR